MDLLVYIKIRLKKISVLVKIQNPKIYSTQNHSFNTPFVNLVFLNIYCASISHSKNSLRKDDFL